MKNRTLIKRLPWLALPLVLLAVMLVVRYNSPLFEGRRWLQQQRRSAVRLDVGSVYMSDEYEPALSPQKISTTDRAEIQSLLAPLNAVGSLNMDTAAPPLGAILGNSFRFTLFDRNGHEDFLLLYPIEGEYRLAHLQSFSPRAPVLGAARVRSDSFASFQQLYNDSLEEQLRRWNSPNFTSR